MDTMRSLFPHEGGVSGTRLVRRTKLQDALQVRERALLLFDPEGDWSTNGSYLIRTHHDALSIMLSAGRPQSYGGFCGLDIWFEGQKVLNLGWGSGEVVLVSYKRRGDWEHLLPRLKSIPEGIDIGLSSAAQ
jgi:hypothetical protein